jgi:hypothetical protein
LQIYFPILEVLIFAFLGAPIKSKTLDNYFQLKSSFQKSEKAVAGRMRRNKRNKVIKKIYSALVARPVLDCQTKDAFQGDFPSVLTNA